MPLPGDFEFGVTSVNGSVRDEAARRPPDGDDPRSAGDPDDMFRFETPAPSRAAAGPAESPGQGSELRRPQGHAVERLRGWIVDRLPDPLKGRWRMDHRVGTALSAVAVVCGISIDRKSVV